MDLNSPDIRQNRLGDRLDRGLSLVAADIAVEFEVSPDTVRRDLIALEAAGRARRVRGGALPVTRPAPPIADRLADNAVAPALVTAALRAIGGSPTLLLDGGASVLAVAERLAPVPGRLVITPAPRAALAAQAAGIEVVLLGGTLSAAGGIATGMGTEAQLTGIAADIALLGVCGLAPDFGLGADDLAEAGVKRAMAEAAGRTFLLTGAQKLGRRGRHRVLPCDRIDALITDADGAQTAPYAALGIELHHA